MAPQAGGTEGLPILNDGEPGLPPQVAGVSLVRARFRTPGKLDQAALLSDILVGCPGHALRFEGVLGLFLSETYMCFLIRIIDIGSGVGRPTPVIRPACRGLPQNG
jgi:hypothetical protein